MAESKEEIKINLGHLASALRKLRNLRLMSSDYITVLTLLKYNEPTSISSQKFDSILIKAIIEEFSGIDRDVLLMALGLLQGYEREIKIGTRRENYLKNSDYITNFYYDNRGEYEKVDSDQQRKYRNSLIDAEKNRIDELADFLANKIKKKEFDEFIKDLKDYYDSDTDTPILPEPEYIKKRKKIPEQPKDDFKTNDNDPHIEPTLSLDKKGQEDRVQQIAESLAKITNELRHIKILVAVLLVALISFSMIYFWQTKNSSADDETPTVPSVNSVQLSEEALTDNSLLVEMETFSIDEGDKDIPLAPGYSKVLPIKNPEPSHADISTLKVESSDESIVWEKNGYLTASEKIPEGETYKVYIKITAKKHIEFICITVESPVISDDAEGMVGSGMQSDL